MAVQVIVVLLYVLVNIAIGWWASSRVKNVGDFFVANRSIGPWVSAFAFGTTYFSAVLFIGYAGKLGWGYGMHTLWIAAGNVLVGSLLAWWVLARRTREMTARLDAITMPEFLAARYGWPLLRGLAAAIVFVFLVPYSASVYQGLAYLFEQNLHINYTQANLLMAGITAIYLLMGGYLAVTITDFFQGLVQIIGVVVLIYLVAGPNGGVLQCVAQGSLAQNAPAFGAPGPFPGWVTLACLVVVTSLGVWGMPQMVQKFYSIKRVRDIKPAMIISTLFCVLIAGSAYFNGGMSRLLLNPATLPFDPKLEPDKIVPFMLAMHTPSWFSVLILLIVLAASMSTLASLVLVSSAAISVDLLGFRVKGEGADKRGVLVMRLLCALFIGVSVLLAAYKLSFIVNLMAFSWGALAGTFMAAYIYGLFWKKATLPGAVAAMLTGLGIAVLMPILWRVSGPAGLIPVAKSPIIPLASACSMIVPLVVLPLVSSFTKPPAAEVVDQAFHGALPEDAEPSADAAE